MFQVTAGVAGVLKAAAGGVQVLPRGGDLGVSALSFAGQPVPGILEHRLGVYDGATRLGERVSGRGKQDLEFALGGPKRVTGVRHRAPCLHQRASGRVE